MVSMGEGTACEKGLGRRRKIGSQRLALSCVVAVLSLLVAVVVSTAPHWTSVRCSVDACNVVVVIRSEGLAGTG